ncbi:MAG: oxygenase MpaB family protein [Myxococcota bacterium]
MSDSRRSNLVPRGVTAIPSAECADRDDELLSLAYPDGLPDGARGLFRDDSAIRRISGENAMLFGGGCALLLEIAHPLVAAGVARHSNFRSEPLVRLQRTLEAMNEIVFGDLDVALAAARRVWRVHAQVRGRLSLRAGPFGPESTYDGRDPELQRWVWASLLWTSLRVLERLLEPVSAAEKQAFYHDHRVVALVLRVTPGLVPSDFPAFLRYFDDVVSGGTLTVTDEARSIAQFVLDPPVSASGGRLLRAMTTALLPPPIRMAFGLSWEEADAARLDSLCGAVRGLRSRGPLS